MNKGMVFGLALGLVVAATACSDTAVRRDSEGIVMPDTSHRFGESDQERRERLAQEWEEYYAQKAGVQAGREDRSPSRSDEAGTSDFLGLGIVVNLGVIVGFYVLTRMTDFLFPGPDGTRGRSLQTRCMAVVTMLVTVIALADILF